MSRCRSCQAEIEFVRTSSGRAVPLDADPTPEGNVEIINGTARVLGPHTLELLTPEERARLRMPHHATCPQGKAWKGSDS